MPQYLQKRRQGWYAVLEVPRPLRVKMGKPRFIQSLQTDSLKVAEVRKHTLIAQWKADVEAARGSSTNLDRVVLFSRNAKPFGSSWQSLNTQKTTGKAKSDTLESGMLLESTSDEGQSANFHNKKYSFRRHLEDYEKTLGNLELKSKDMRLSDIKRFLKHFKYAEDATSREIKAWVEQTLINENELSAATCRRIVSNLRQYWKYLVDRKDLCIAEPFKEVVPARTTTRKQEVATRRRHFEPQDYQKLIKAARESEDDQLCNLIQLGAYTGCRIEELCSLTTEAVKDDRLLIEDAKTETGCRIIPIHKEMAVLVATMKKMSADGYLFSGLTYNKYGDRSNAIGKRFGKLKLKLGYGSNYVYHSFRKGVATQWERLGIAENISANLLGHDIPTMTYGLYSGNKLDFHLLQETINKLKWD